MKISRLKHISRELRRHAPFTALGALIGTVVMAIVFAVGLAQSASEDIFHILHPAHLLLSAIVTSAVYRQHGNIWVALVIGFIGSVGICSISDIALPHMGGVLLGAEMHLHVCILEHPWLVVSFALLGAVIGALTRRWTRYPHAAHVLISTMASLFYLVAFGIVDWALRLPLVFVVLFIAVWLPCCASDIIFPHLFTKGKHH